ncbi:MAG: IS110 family transposase [Bacillota bacterium]
MRMFVGIDVSLKDFKARMFDAEGEEIAKRFRAKNDDPGAESFVKYLIEICSANNVDSLRIGLEATSVYGWHLQMHLAGETSLVPFHPQVYVFNPKVIANFRKQYVDIRKDDWFDCLVIADRLRFGRLPESCQVDFRYLPLQRLTRFRHHLIQTITREKNYFLSNLFFKFNTICQNKVLSDTFGAASEAILTEFLSPEEIAARPLDELIDILMEKGKSNFSNPEATAKALKHAASSAYKLHGSLLKPVNLILATSLQTIRTLERQVKDIDKTIEKELSHFQNTLQSMPGRPVCAAGLIAEIGDIHRFDNEKALAKYAGLTWRKDQSADFEADDTPLTKTGNAYLRSYFVLAANNVRIRDPKFAEFYTRKFKESTTHHHRRALVLTARKLVRVVDALLRSNQLYMPQVQRRII